MVVLRVLRSVLKYFFLALGVLFFILLVGVAVLIVFDPLGLKPVITGEFDGSAPDEHPLLDARQEQALRVIGMDPAKVPTEVTPELKACAERTLGAERAAELEAGAEPEPADLYRARECLQEE